MMLKSEAISPAYLFSKSDLKKLIFPLVIEQLLAITVGMADTMMVSAAGEAAVSGVSLVDMVNVLIINIFAAIATGGAVVTSQLLGSGRRDRAVESSSQLIFVTIILSVFITILMTIFRSHILHLFFGNIEQAVMDNALIYLIISAVSYPFLAVYNACAALFRSMGNSKISMYISLFINILNVILNGVFIFGFGMGAAGVALASCISRGVAAVFMMIKISSRQNTIYVCWKNVLIPKLHMIKNILRIGIPNGFENSLFQLGRVLVVSIITQFGTMQVAANAVANNLDALGCIPGQAFNLAIITVVGQCVGARDFDQAKFYMKYLLKLAYLCTIALNIVVLCSLPWILPIYNLTEETLNLAKILVLIHNGCAMLLWPLSFVLPNALRAASDVRYTMIVAVFSMLTFRILFSYIIGIHFNMGAVGVWIAMVMDWIFRAVCFTIRAVSGRWKEKVFI